MLSLAGMLVHGFTRGFGNWALDASHGCVIVIGVEGLRRRIRGLHQIYARHAHV